MKLSITFKKRTKRTTATTTKKKKRPLLLLKTALREQRPRFARKRHFWLHRTTCRPRDRKPDAVSALRPRTALQTHDARVSIGMRHRACVGACGY